MGEVSTPTLIVQFYKSQGNKHTIRKEGNMTTDVTEHEKALCRAGVEVTDCVCLECTGPWI